MKDQIRQLLREGTEPKTNTQVDYKQVYGLLQNKIFNHAEIIEKLWGDKEDTNRSKFRKKLERIPNDSGKVHEFDADEIANIKKTLIDTSTDVFGTLGNKKTPERDKVEKLLQNNIFNHADIIEKMWGDKEASNRSVFRKKLNKEPNGKGKVHDFTPEEVSEISGILKGVSTDIYKSLGGKKKKKKDGSSEEQ